MSRTLKFALALVALLALTFALQPAWAQAEPSAPGTPNDAAEGRGLPLRDFLNPDGTLNLPPGGIEGSIDPAGFRLVSGPGEEPRFAEEGSVDISEEAAGPRPEAAGDDCWESRFSSRGTNGPVYAVWYLSPTRVYIGGNFTTVSGVSANYIAQWNGTSWIALGSGTDAAVRAFAWDGTHLYAGGSFTTAGGVAANNIAKWDGTAWSALGSGTDGPVYALAYRSTTGVYAGGTFTSPGQGLALWYTGGGGGYWTNAGAANNSVFALLWTGSDLWVGGAFTQINGVGANRVARWNVSTGWSALGSGTNGLVYALAYLGGTIYAGGSFATAGGVPASRIAAWNVGGSTWSALGTGTTSTVRTLASYGTSLYAGGQFTDAGGSGARYFAEWNGTSWGPVGSDMNGTVYALKTYSGNILLGGDFDFVASIDSSVVSRFARWDLSNYYGVGTLSTGDGVGSTVNDLARCGTDIYAGGVFTTAGGVAANRIARWGGTAWNALGTGMNNTVNALAWDGANLYAGGAFTTAGGTTANRIAKWDGSTWSALGSGMNNTVYALAWDGANLYAGGTFTQAGGVTVGYIAMWDGIAWSALGSGMNQTVAELAWGGANLYAGGQFSTAGGGAANYVAMWDGAGWSALGSGMNGSVSALAWNGGNLYAGGAFTTAGGTPANRVARWDGTTWRVLGSGVNSNVYTLAWDGTNLYAGGAFTAAEGATANRIARWDGTYWYPVGSGMDGLVNALVGADQSLWAGGSFQQAGLAASANIALFANAASIAGHPTDQSSCDGGNASFPVTATGYGLSYQWQEDAGTGWVDLSDGGIYSGATMATLNLTGVTGGMFGYRYRCAVTGTCGSATSDPATLTDAPVLTTNPASITTCSQTAASFSVAATGAASYRWQEDAGSGFADLADGGIYSGAGTPTLVLARLTGGVSGRAYRCVVTGGCTTTATSNSATLTVGATPPSVGTLKMDADGSDLLISWERFASSSWADYYEVLRSTTPSGPFDTSVGKAYGAVHGLYVDLNAEPPTAYYKVRAVKGTCTGPIDPQRSVWLFDEGAGGTAYDSVNSNHGILTGATWAVGQGVRGSALEFNGTDAFVGAVNPLLPTGGLPYTLMAWIRPDVWDKGIIGWGPITGGCCQWNNLVLAWIGTNGIVNEWVCNDLWAPTGTATGSWHHVAATWDGSVRAVYLDGICVNAEVTSCLNVPSTDSFRIGCVGSRYFDGLLDEVAVFDEALGQTAIQSYMNSGYASLHPLDTREAVWHFDDGSGATAQDSRGLHDATLHGGTWVAGQSGTAVDFNGASDYAEANPGPAPTGPITVVAKVWLDTYKPWASFVEKYASDNQDCWALGLDPSGQKLIFMFNNVGPAWPNAVTGSSALPLAQWVQVAVASNGTTATFYVNGVADGTFPVSAICTSGTVNIGANLAGGDEFFDGKIDDLEIFDRWLSQTEIQGLQ